MRGLIAAALGGLSKGVGQVATAQIEINARKALMEAEEEMRDRLAEAAEGRDEKRQIAAEGRAEAQQIAAEGRAISNIPLTAEATAKAEETNMARRYGDGSNYPGLLGSQMTAMETPAQRATREAAESESSWENETRDLRRKLAAAKTEEERDDYARQLGAMSGQFGPTNRSYSDVVALGNGYAKMASDSLKMAEDSYTDEDKKLFLADAKKYQALADNAFQGVTSARLPGGGGEPRISTDEEYDALPSGAVFFDPDGIRRIKP